MSGARHQRGGRTGGRGWASMMPASPLQRDQSGASGKPSPSPSPDSSPLPSSCSVNDSSSAVPSTRLDRGVGRGVGWAATLPVSPLLLREQSASSGKPSPCPLPSLSPLPSPLPRRDMSDCLTPELQFLEPLRSGARGSPGEYLTGSRSDESNGGGRDGNRPFDLLLRPSPQAAPTLQPSLLEKNKQRKAQEEKVRSSPGHRIPRPGMVLLKNYLSHDIQVDILTQCRNLGLGPGGFYRPGYRDGAKLSLQMMCLGKNWDPETRRYEGTRSYDDAQPPAIPETFKKLVAEAMQTAHELIRERRKQSSAEEELPGLSPDLCIVNFYQTNGKLGLHQDRDESEDSLHKGLPVVSFSIGDSAIFEYGDSRIKTDQIELESGDVLIFGGKSRHIFHGVTTIKGKTAPKRLIDETYLRPGRLNLTFRQY